MFKKLALTFTFALAMFLGSSVQSVQASSADFNMTETVDGFTVKKEKKKKKKKKKKNKKKCTGEKSNCCASKTMGASGVSTSGNAGAVAPDAAKKNCATKCANSSKKSCTKKAAVEQ